MIPVIFIDTRATDPEWFQCARQQAQSYNERVHWIGARPQADVPVVLYSNAVDLKQFQKDYIHLSTNPEWFERICIERWFILRDFLLEQNLSAALYIDSDILLFCNADAEWRKFWHAYDFTLALQTSAAANFVRLETLKSFCGYVASLYRPEYREHDTDFRYLRELYEQMRRENKAGGICDMTLWNQFAIDTTRFRYGELTRVQDDNSTWDHNINASDGYKLRDNIKKIDFVVDFDESNRHLFTPVGYTPTHKQIRFNALHFQGGAKKLIPDYVRLRAHI